MRKSGVRVEHMTAGALRRGGLTDVQMSLLVQDALKGSAVCRRILERAVQSQLYIVQPGKIRCPLRHMHYRPKTVYQNGVLSCPINIRPGVTWDYDTLYAEFPDTILNAIPGKKLNEVLGHPDIDPDAIAIRPIDKDAALSIQSEHVALSDTTTRQRFDHIFYKIRARIEEGRLDNQMPAKYRMGFLLMTLGTSLLAFIMLHNFYNSGEGKIASILVVIAALNAAFGYRNSLRKRPFSLLAMMMAETRHQGNLQNIRDLKREN